MHRLRGTPGLQHDDRCRNSHLCHWGGSGIQVYSPATLTIRLDRYGPNQLPKKQIISIRFRGGSVCNAERTLLRCLGL
jgi:hypothetical protein